MLCLERDTVPEVIDRAAFPRDTAVEKVPRIKLQAGLGGGDLHRAATRWFDDVRSEYQRVRSRAATVQYPIVIVAVAVMNLGVLSLIYSLADCVRCPEIERRALHGRDLTRRNQRRVDWGGSISVDGEHMSKNIARRVAGEIPVRML